jgi:hypothetical protein
MVELECKLKTVGLDGTLAAIPFGVDDVDLHVASWDRKKNVDGQVGASSVGHPVTLHRRTSTVSSRSLAIGRGRR